MEKTFFVLEMVTEEVKVVHQDLRREYGISLLADREMQSLENKVSPELFGLLTQQLLAFHGDMQLEMAEDLVIFASEHVAHTTGCPSADMILDLCYQWIACEHHISRIKM